MTVNTMLFRVLLLLCLLVPLSANAQTSRQTFTLSVVPQFTPVDIGLRWTPLLRHLETETGYSFQLRLLDKIPRFETDFLAGIPDLVYLNPYHMLMAAEAQGYIPLVRGSDPLIGILVTEQNGPIKTLQDLDGKRLPFRHPMHSAPRSTCAHC